MVWPWSPIELLYGFVVRAILVVTTAIDPVIGSTEAHRFRTRP